MESARVKLGAASYDIVIGPGAVAGFRAIIPQIDGLQRFVIVADSRVADLHLPALLSGIGSGWPSNPVAVRIEPGESSKSPERLAMLYDRFAEMRLGRQDLVITFGGGVVGDLGGYAAATWMRGVRYIQIPTTIEAAVDAAVGGKTGINHASGKNLIGAFHQPSAVVIDTDFLATLDERDFIAGLAESAKHAIVRDPPFVGWHEKHAAQIRLRDASVVAELIARNCRIKADIVERDEREGGLRAILNYGHTIGHALEHVLGYALRHGECVALGILVENELAVARKLLARKAAERIRELLAALGLPTRLPSAVAIDAVVSATRLDKKARGGAVRFVLISEIGAPATVDDISPAEIAAAMKAIKPA